MAQLLLHSLHARMAGCWVNLALRVGGWVNESEDGLPTAAGTPITRILVSTVLASEAGTVDTSFGS